MREIGKAKNIIVSAGGLMGIGGIEDAQQQARGTRKRTFFGPGPTPRKKEDKNCRPDDWAWQGKGEK